MELDPFPFPHSNRDRHHLRLDSSSGYHQHQLAQDSDLGEVVVRPVCEDEAPRSVPRSALSRLGTVVPFGRRNDCRLFCRPLLIRNVLASDHISKLRQ